MFDQNSQDVCAENVMLEVRASCCLLLLMNVSAETVILQNSVDVSTNALTYSIDIMVGKLAFLMFSDVFPQ